MFAEHTHAIKGLSGNIIYFLWIILLGDNRNILWRWAVRGWESSSSSTWSSPPSTSSSTPWCSATSTTTTSTTISGSVWITWRKLTPIVRIKTGFPGITHWWRLQYLQTPPPHLHQSILHKWFSTLSPNSCCLSYLHLFFTQYIQSCWNK